MRIEEIIWLRDVVDKLSYKHGVEVFEVEDALIRSPKFRFVEKGEREGEDVYMALGQTGGGRYLTILFIRKPTDKALILSARNMAPEERSMAANKRKQMPKLESVGKLTEFFETQDMGEYWDELPEAHFEVDIRKHTHVFALDDDFTARLGAIAKNKHVPSERLINV